MKHAEEARSVLTGLAAGKGLDAHVRETAMKLVSSEMLSSATAAEVTRPTGTSTLPEEALQDGSTYRDEAADDSQTQRSGFTSDKKEHASRVLGLQRRDLT